MTNGRSEASSGSDGRAVGLARRGQGYHQPIVTQATKSATTRPKTSAMTIHSTGRSGGQSALGAARRTTRSSERPAERDERHRPQQDVRQPGKRGHSAHDALAAARALPPLLAGVVVPLARRRRSRRGSPRRPRPPGRASPPAWSRHLISILPSLSPRSPTTTRSGIPIRSASLNFTPGRWSRSSTSTSSPAAGERRSRAPGPAPSRPRSGPGAGRPPRDRAPATAAR